MHRAFSRYYSIHGVKGGGARVLPLAMSLLVPFKGMKETSTYPDPQSVYRGKY